MTKTETLRVLKSMQTDALQQQLAILQMMDIYRNDEMGVHEDDLDTLGEEIHDAYTTAANHVAALQHIVDRLGAR